MKKLLLLASVILLFTHCGDGEETDSEECNIECHPPHLVSNSFNFKIINSDSVDIYFDKVDLVLDSMELYSIPHRLDFMIEPSQQGDVKCLTARGFIADEIYYEDRYILKLNSQDSLTLLFTFIQTADPYDEGITCNCPSIYIDVVYRDDFSTVICDDYINKKFVYVNID